MSRIYNLESYKEINSIFALDEFMKHQKIVILSSQRSYLWNPFKKFTDLQRNNGGITYDDNGNVPCSFLNWILQPDNTFNGITLVECEKSFSYAKIPNVLEIGKPRRLDYFTNESEIIYGAGDSLHRKQSLHTALNGYFISPEGNVLYFYYDLFRNQFINDYEQNSDFYRYSISLTSMHKLIKGYLVSQNDPQYFVKKELNNHNTVREISNIIKEEFGYTSVPSDINNIFDKNIKNLISSYYGPRDKGFFGFNIPKAKDKKSVYRIFNIQNKGHSVSKADRAMASISTNESLKNISTHIYDLLKKNNSLFKTKPGERKEEERIIHLFLIFIQYKMGNTNKIEDMNKIINKETLLNDPKICNYDNFQWFGDEYINACKRIIEYYGYPNSYFLFNRKIQNFGLNILTFLIFMEMINPYIIRNDEGNFQKFCTLLLRSPYEKGAESHFIDLVNYFKSYNNKNSKKLKDPNFKNAIKKLETMNIVDKNNTLDLKHGNQVNREIALEIFLGLRKTPDAFNNHSKFDIDHNYLQRSGYKKDILLNTSGNLTLIPSEINKKKGVNKSTSFWKEYKLSAMDFFNFPSHYKEPVEFDKNNPQIIVRNINYELYKHKSHYIKNVLGIETKKSNDSKNILNIK